LLNSPEPPPSAGPGPRACWGVVHQMGQISALVQERAVTPLDDPLGHLTAGAWEHVAADGLSADR